MASMAFSTCTWARSRHLFRPMWRGLSDERGNMQQIRKLKAASGKTEKSQKRKCFECIRILLNSYVHKFKRHSSRLVTVRENISDTVTSRASLFLRTELCRFLKNQDQSHRRYMIPKRVCFLSYLDSCPLGSQPALCRPPPRTYGLLKLSAAGILRLRIVWVQWLDLTSNLQVVFCL